MAPQANTVVKEKMSRKPRTKPEGIKEITPATPSKAKVAATPNKTAPTPASIKKSRKYRPKPAHSGVPMPEKLKKLLEKQLQNLDDSLFNN